MSRVLLGTGNKSKLKWMQDLLQDYNIDLVLPKEVGIYDGVEEKGLTAVENASIKAKQYFEMSHLPVIATDNAMLFADFPIDDPRQPHTKIRRMLGEKEMNDQELIEYYSSLAKENGGRLTAYYETSYAVVDKEGKLYQFEDPYSKNPKYIDLTCFYLVDKPHKTYIPGRPLDSIRVDKYTKKYLYDLNSDDISQVDHQQEQAYFDSAKDMIRNFIVKNLDIKKK